ncbi:DUF6020 family protein [Thermophilibacter mediterraneus]|uniref:DUF6020 family protein n=1 Tax=Thermophilibacter mediterraneus TaxID=1871031 RepID=UPI00320A2866
MADLVAYVLIAAAGVLLCRRLEVRPDGWSVGLGALLSSFQVLGRAYRDHGTFRAIYATPADLALNLVLLAVGAVALALLVRLAFWLMDRPAARLRADGGKAPEPARFLPTPAVMALLVVAWLPYLVTFLPGSFTFDGTNQMDVLYGFLPMTNHHPYLMTLLMGSVFDLGRRLGSDNLGIFLWVALQTLVQAAALSLSVRSMRRMGAPRAALVAATAFFALTPAWGAYAQAFLKDTLFASLLCLYVTLLAESWERCRREGEVSPGQAAGLLALGVALCVTRHNGAFVVALCLPVVVVAMRGRRSRALVAGAAAGALAVYLAVSSALLPALGVAPAGRQESLGALFQMTARYLREAPEDVEPWERDAISAVLDYDAIAESYNGSKSDPVKVTYHGTDEDLGAYLRAWASMGLRHPGVYLDAFLNGLYGYLHVDTSCPHDTWDYRFYTYGPLPGVPDDFEVAYVMPEGARAVVISACNAFQGIPVLGWLGHCGVYTWALLLACVHTLRSGRARQLVVVAPSLVMLAICFVSPVNGYLRYMLPIMAEVPLTLWFSAHAAAVDPAPRLNVRGRHARRA